MESTRKSAANETEKVTINLSVVDLGQIDLLVTEGLYSNRTDFVRSAIRLQMHQHSEVLKQAVVRKAMVIGVVVFDRARLEGMRRAGQRLAVRVIGLAILADDIPPELAAAVIESVKVHGVLRASAAVRAAIADRIA